MGINLLEDLGYRDDDVAVRKAREAAAVYAELVDSLIESRERAGLKQRQLAKRMGTSQSAVSELENGSDARLSTIIRYAQAAGCEIHIRVTPAGPAEHTQNPEWITIDVKTPAAPKRARAWVDTSAGLASETTAVPLGELLGAAK